MAKTKIVVLSESTLELLQRSIDAEVKKLEKDHEILSINGSCSTAISGEMGSYSSNRLFMVAIHAKSLE